MLNMDKKSPVILVLTFFLSVIFFISGIVINIVQGLLYYGLRPFSKYAYRKINYYLAYSLYSQLVFMAEWWSGTDVHLYIDKEDFDKYYGKEHAYLVMNHRYDVDWLVGWIFCDRIQVLGNCKAYAKKSIQYLPTMGYAWKFAESVFLERNWEKDREAIGVQVRELVQYPDPIWLLLFAEGTRFTEEKHEASLTFAREKGLPELSEHLTPRTKGFTCSIPHLRGHVHGVYNVQIAFKEKRKVEPTVTTMLHGTPLDAHMFIERIDIAEVPEDEEGAAQWLRDLYIKKDRLMKSFLRTGDWFSESGVRRVDSFKLPRRIYSLLNVVSWGIVILCPLLYYFIQLLLSGSTLAICISLVIIITFFKLLYKLIDQTKISKGSSYGKTTPTTPTKPNDGIVFTDGKTVKSE